MTKIEQQEYFNDFVSEQWRIMAAKGDDYASDEDRLSNFKIVAQIAKCDIKTVFAVFMATKVVRLGELLSGKDPKNESIHDSLIDNANYSILASAAINEK